MYLIKLSLSRHGCKHRRLVQICLKLGIYIIRVSLGPDQKVLFNGDFNVLDLQHCIKIKDHLILNTYDQSYSTPVIEVLLTW